MMSEKLKLRGALGAIERRVAARQLEMNEFNESPPQATFEATQRIVPNHTWDGVVRKIMEIRIGTSYANVKGDDDEAYRMAEENAMRQMCSFLYEDVIHDLRVVMGELSAGKRNASMRLIGELMRRLTGGSMPQKGLESKQPDRYAAHHLACVLRVTGGLEGPCDCGVEPQKGLEE